MRRTIAVMDTLRTVDGCGGTLSQAELLRRMDVRSNDGREHRRQMLHQMEKLGWVERSDGPRQSTRWTITPEGQAVLGS